MKNVLSLIVFVLISSSLIAQHLQPCKVVKEGMSKAEVQKLVGKPAEIDTIGSAPDGSDTNGFYMDGNKVLMVVWQFRNKLYGNNGIITTVNQRVEFMGDKVSHVIADGEKYDALMKAFQNGDVPNGQLIERIAILNKEGCK